MVPRRTLLLEPGRDVERPLRSPTRSLGPSVLPQAAAPGRARGPAGGGRGEGQAVLAARAFLRCPERLSAACTERISQPFKK